MTSRQSDIRIGYVVLAHQNFHHVERLVRRLVQTGDGALVHVDRRAGQRAAAALGERLNDLPAVHVRQDFKTAWGHYGLIEATAVMTRSLIEIDSTLDFVSIHSGADYPTRPVSAFRQLLTENRERGFASFFSESAETPGFKSRYELYYPLPYIIRHRRARNIAMRLQRCLGVRRTLPANMLPAFGWHWWTLPTKIAGWLAEQSVAPHIARFYRTTAIPEEMVFQTLLASSEYKDMIDNNCLRFMTSNPWGQMPKWLDIHDLPDIRKSDAFFCRKVNSEADLGLCDALDSSNE